MPATSRGYDGGWLKLRDAFIKVNPMCAICGAAAEVAHHKVPVNIAPQLRLDWNNLMPVCRKCHAAIHNSNNGHPAR